jgi:hypothetical protein
MARAKNPKSLYGVGHRRREAARVVTAAFDLLLFQDAPAPTPVRQRAMAVLSVVLREAAYLRTEMAKVEAFRLLDEDKEARLKRDIARRALGLGKAPVERSMEELLDRIDSSERTIVADMREGIRS